MLAITNRSVVMLIGGIGATLALIAVVAASVRVIGWVVAATTLAGLAWPAVERVDRRTPRAVAVVAVAVAVAVPVGVLTWALVDDFQREARRLERAAVSAAVQIERSDNLGETARELRLAERVEGLVEGIPVALQGGSGPEALRTAATRGVAFLATSVLTLFLLLHGPGLVAGGIGLIRDPDRRERTAARLGAAYRAAWRYLVLMGARGAGVGVVAAVAAAAVGLPGPRLLGLWVGVWSFLPSLGVLVGGASAALLAVPRSWGAVAGLMGGAVALELIATLVVGTRIERRSVHVGPFLTLAAAVVGLEAYGFGGMAVGVAWTVFAVAVVTAPGLPAGSPDAGPPVPGDLPATVPGGDRQVDPAGAAHR